MTKTFRKLLAPLVFGVLLVIPLFHPHTAAATDYPLEGYPGETRISVYLSGNTGSITSYTVTATRRSDGHKFNFTPYPNGTDGDGHALFLSENLQPATTCTGAESDNNKTANLVTYDLTATQGGKVVSAAQNYTFCNRVVMSGYIYGPATLTVSSKASATASVTATLTWTDSTTGETKPMDGQYTVLTFRPDGCSSSSCDITVQVNSDGTFSKSGLPPGNYTLTAAYNPCPGSQDCQKPVISQSVTLKAGANTLGTLNPTGNGGGGAQTCSDGSTPDSSGNCPSESDAVDCGSGAFNWVICPFIQLALKGVSWLDTFIMNQLNVDVGGIFDHTSTSGSDQSGYYEAWSQFRILATAILMIGGLVMVVSTALGFEFLDAYTIRKTLPRLLIAIIGISLSWPLMRLCVNFFDTVGYDLRAIMYHPFLHMKGTASVGTGILSTFVVGAGLLVYGAVALTFLLTAFMAIFVGFLILVIRQAAIIMLVILAPIAIACYILPNTQRVWKLWYDNFLGLLLLFPIISVLIAAGHIFATVTINSNQGNSPTAIIAQAVALIAYFIPYFLLPMAARMATGVIGNIAGFVNDRHKGAFDRLKGFRDAGRQRKHQQRMDGEINKGLGGNMYRRAVRGFTDPKSAAFNPTRRGRAQYAAFKERHEMGSSAALLKEHGVTEMMQDDDVRVALMSGSAERARAMLGKMGRTKEQIRSTIGSADAIGFSERAGLAALQIESTMGKGRGLDAIAKANGVDASTQMQQLVSSVGHGLDEAGRERLRQTTMYNFGGAGRGDLRQGSVADVLDKKFDTQIAATATEGAMTSLAGEMTDRIRTGSLPRKVQSGAQLKAAYESRSRMSEPTRQALIAQMEGVGINFSSSEPVDVQLAKQMVDPAVKASMELAQQTYDFHTNNLRTKEAAGTATPADRALVQQARAQLELDSRPVMAIAQQMSSIASTYSTGTPYSVRES